MLSDRCSSRRVPGRALLRALDRRPDLGTAAPTRPWLEERRAETGDLLERPGLGYKLHCLSTRA